MKALYLGKDIFYITNEFIYKMWLILTETTLLATYPKKFFFLKLGKIFQDLPLKL